jgi:hypothetical protein
MSDTTSEAKSPAASSGIGLTFPQIAASALAAATAAILGSFMGVLGTIGGAAVASIISTVGSALYQRSLEATRDRVKQKLVVTNVGNTRVAGAVNRVAGGPAQAQAQTRQAPPTQVQPGRPMVVPPTPGPGVPMPPGHQQARPGMPPADPTRRVPGPTGPPTQRPGQPVPPGRVALRAEGVADPTRVHPQVNPDAAPTEVRPTAFIPQSRQTGTPPGGGPTAVMGQPGRPGPGGPGGPMGPIGPGGPGDGATQVAPLEPEPARPRFSLAALKTGLKGLGWKTWVTLGGVTASVFVIALLATFGVETAAGRPLSGGTGGTSVGSLFGQETGTSEATTTPAESSTDNQDTSTTTQQETEQQQAPEDGDPTTSQSTRPTTRSPQTSQNGILPNLGGGSGGSGSGGGSTNG